jgi:hypothetical protein
MAIVCPWAASVEAWISAGRDVEIPRPDCPSCGQPMIFSSGYERSLRLAFDPDAGLSRPQRLWVPRVRCRSCGIAPGLLPAFCLLRRLDEAKVIGTVVASVAAGGPAAAAAAEAAVPRSTARGWAARFAQRAPVLAAGFASLAIALGAPAFDLPAHRPRAASEAIGRAWDAAVRRLGGNVVGLWRFASIVSGGALIASTTDPPWGVDLARGLLPPFG